MLETQSRKLNFMKSSVIRNMSDATSGWKFVSITVATGGFLHKGQVNFEMSFWCLQIDQKNNEIFARISALASKKRSNQKSSVRESK